MAIKRLVVWKGQEKRGRGVNIKFANKGPLKSSVGGFIHQKVYVWDKQCERNKIGCLLCVFDALQRQKGGFEGINVLLLLSERRDEKK